MVCRNAEKAAAAKKEIEEQAPGGEVDLILADLAKKADIEAMAEAFKDRYDRLDLLINNAGIYLPKRQVTPDGYEAMFGINHMGYYLVLQHLLDPLEKGEHARVVNVSSDGHRLGRIRWDDLQSERRFNGVLQYCHTKLMNVLFTVALAKRLPSGITANCLHPGAIASGFAQDEKSAFGWVTRLSRFAMLTPEQGAQTTLHLATSPEVDGVTGQYFSKSRAVKPSRRARNAESAEQLWKVTAELAGIDRFAS
jgi:NAD(P)-dependent dehydrogenase (short-subunit alcohol dehydrogenase family)